MTTRLTGIFVVALMMSLFSVSTDAGAHEVFQDVLKEQYMLKAFSCKTCHQDSKNRKLRTDFAERVYKKLKPLNLAEKFDAAVKAEDAAKAKDPASVGKDKGPVFEFDKIAAVEFKKVFKEVAKETMTIDEMIKQGLFNGARLDTKKIEAAKKEKEAGKVKAEK